MKILVSQVALFYIAATQIWLTLGDYYTTENSVGKLGIIASPIRRNAVPNRRSNIIADIRLLKQKIKIKPSSSSHSSNLSTTNRDLSIHQHHPEVISHQKRIARGRLSSLFWKTEAPSSNAPESSSFTNDNVEYGQQGSEVAEASGGWGWSKPKKHKEEVKEGGGAFSILDVLLSALSLVSFGAFLINLLASLLSLLGFFTTGTSTGTGTGTSTSTSTTTGTNASGIVNSISSYFRNGRKSRNGLRKKKKHGRLQADAGFGGKKIYDEDRESGEAVVTDDISSELESAEVLRRTRRSIFQPNVHPCTALDVMARNILNSIESVEANYECMEKVICDSNRHAQVVGRGLEFFMPIYMFSTSYFGQKFGLHHKLPIHSRAIILGVQESNCHHNFPHCSHGQEVE